MSVVETVKIPPVEMGKINRGRVRDWFAAHLCGTQRECAAALDLSPMAVNRHVQAIRAEWTKKKVGTDDR